MGISPRCWVREEGRIDTSALNYTRELLKSKEKKTGETEATRLPIASSIMQQFSPPLLLIHLYHYVCPVFIFRERYLQFWPSSSSTHPQLEKKNHLVPLSPAQPINYTALISIARCLAQVVSQVTYGRALCHHQVPWRMPWKTGKEQRHQEVSFFVFKVIFHIFAIVPLL